MLSDKARQWAWENDVMIAYHPEYDHDFAIVQDWNTVRDGSDNMREVFVEILTGLGYDGESWNDHEYWGFSDEYTTCSECGDVICTSPSSHQWIPDFWLNDDGYTCGNCVRSDWAEDYIEDLIDNRQDTARGCHLVNPTDHGFTLVLEGLENGMHPGQADNPIALQKWANDNGLAVLWKVRPSQFDCGFDGYMAWRDCPDCDGQGGDYHDNVWQNCPRCDDNHEPIPLTEQEKTVIRDTLVSHSANYNFGNVDYLKPDFRESPDLATRMQAALKSLSKPFAKIHNDGSVEQYDTIEEMYPHLRGE